MSNPAIYDAWYQSAKGNWIGQQEFSTLLKLFTPKAGQSLLDVGCGTGYFSQHFHQLGLVVTGLDADPAMLEFAESKASQIMYVEGNALALPFADDSFDYCSAITSLCFVNDVEAAITEMLRVSRQGVLLGLLNRHSLLHPKKQHSESYREARWDSISEIKQWCQNINPEIQMDIKSSVLIPSAGIMARIIEKLLPNYFPFASFLAVRINVNTNG